MTKITGYKKGNVRCTLQATCDEEGCGKECGNSYTELFFKFSFNEKYEPLRVVCLDCWLKKYSNEASFYWKKNIDASIAFHTSKGISIGEPLPEGSDNQPYTNNTEAK